MAEDDHPYRRQGLRAAIGALDPSKLMIAPILFVALLALLDRAVFEFRQEVLGSVPERVTRLS